MSLAIPSTAHCLARNLANLSCLRFSERSSAILRETRRTRSQLLLLSGDSYASNIEKTQPLSFSRRTVVDMVPMDSYPRNSRRTAAGVVLMALTLWKARGSWYRETMVSKTSLIPSRRCLHVYRTRAPPTIPVLSRRGTRRRIKGPPTLS